MKYGSHPKIQQRPSISYAIQYDYSNPLHSVRRNANICLALVRLLDQFQLFLKRPQISGSKLNGPKISQQSLEFRRRFSRWNPWDESSSWARLRSAKERREIFPIFSLPPCTVIAMGRFPDEQSPSDNMGQKRRSNMRAKGCSRRWNDSWTFDLMATNCLFQSNRIATP